jgi:hypothetical protein
VHDVAIAIAQLTEVMHDDQQPAASLNHLAGEIVECTKTIESAAPRIINGKVAWTTRHRNQFSRTALRAQTAAQLTQQSAAQLARALRLCGEEAKNAAQQSSANVEAIVGSSATDRREPSEHFT